MIARMNAPNEKPRTDVRRGRGRVVEFDLANERVILATMVRDANARRTLANDLRDVDFGDPKHRVAFRVIAAMTKQGMAWSEDTFSSIAAGEDFGGFEYLRRVISEYESNANLAHHVERLRCDAAKFDLLSEHVPSLAAACEDPKVPLSKVAQELRAALARVERSESHRHVRTGDPLIDSFYETLRMRSAIGGVFEPTGHDLLDHVLTDGYGPGRLSVIVGRPGMGKSTFVADLIRLRVARSRGTHLGSWEMHPDDYMDMFVAAATGIPASKLTRFFGQLTEEEKDAIAAAAEVYRDARLLSIEENPFPFLPKPASRFEDVNERNLDHIEATIQRVSRDKPVVILDVVGKALMDRRPDNVSLALVRLRGMAQRYGVHLMLLHHLNRAGAEGRPSLEHIKNSGAFEEEADLVIGLDRPWVRATPGRRRKMTDVLDLHVLKQRRGPWPACIRYDFDGARYSLTNEMLIDVAQFEREEQAQSQYGDPSSL